MDSTEKSRSTKTATSSRPLYWRKSTETGVSSNCSPKVEIMALTFDVSVKQNHGLIPLREFLGYGMELADVLSVYYRTSESETETKTKALKAFASWMQNAPFPDNLCFADIYFNPNLETAKNSL